MVKADLPELIRASSTVRRAFRASTPVLFGYLSVGTAFGFLFQQLGFSWYFAPLMSFVSEAASAQFMALSMLAERESLVELAIMVFVINLRHMFYGLSLLKRYTRKFWAKLYLIFGLTDETYSIITTEEIKEDDAKFCLLLTAFNHGYWVVGSTIGALIGTAVKTPLPGIEFMLTSLFVVLTIEQAIRVKAVAPFLIAVVAAVIAGFTFPGQMLFVAIALSAVALVVKQKVGARA